MRVWQRLVPTLVPHCTSRALPVQTCGRPHLDVLHDADEGVEAVQVALGQRVQVARRQRLGAHPRQPAPQQCRLLDPQLRGSSGSIQLTRRSVHCIIAVCSRLVMTATEKVRWSVAMRGHSTPQTPGCPSSTLPRGPRRRWPEGHPAAQAADRPPHRPAAWWQPGVAVTTACACADETYIDSRGDANLLVGSSALHAANPGVSKGPVTLSSHPARVRCASALEHLLQHLAALVMNRLQRRGGCPALSRRSPVLPQVCKLQAGKVCALCRLAASGPGGCHVRGQVQHLQLLTQLLQGALNVMQLMSAGPLCQEHSGAISGGPDSAPAPRRRRTRAPHGAAAAAAARPPVAPPPARPSTGRWPTPTPRCHHPAGARP